MGTRLQVKLAAADNDAVWIVWEDRRREEAVARLAVATDGSARRLRVRAPGRSPAIAAGRHVVLAWQHADSTFARMVEY